MRKIYSFLLLSAVLLACSNEQQKESTVGNATMSASPSTAPSALTADQAAGDTPSVDQAAVAVTSPNRSELRMMSEEAKHIENSTMGLIENYQDSLADRQMREKIQQEFKRMMPEYKDNMLKIGKAELQAQAHSQ